MDHTEELGNELQMFRTALEIAGLPPNAATLPADRQMIVGAMRMHYLDWGGTGTPIFSCTAADSPRIPGTASPRCCASAFDASRSINVGMATANGRRWLTTASRRTSATSRASSMRCGLQRPILVGQSMGGLNSIAYAIRHSEKMRAMVIVDVAPEISAPGADRIRDFASTPELDSPDAFLERAVKFNPIRNPAVLRRSLYYNLRETPAGKWTFKHDQRRRTDDAMRSFTEDRTRLAAEVSKIKCPTLVMRGALSDVLTDDSAEKFARSLPNGRWVRIEKSGHNVQGDNPRAFLDAMQTFFREVGVS